MKTVATVAQLAQAFWLQSKMGQDIQTILLKIMECMYFSFNQKYCEVFY